VGDPKFDGPTTNTPGAPGTQIFEFKVVGPGASLLELGYGKVTDKAAPPQKTWKIFVAAAGVKAGP
jgi:predicted secreted protein